MTDVNDGRAVISRLTAHYSLAPSFETRAGEIVLTPMHVMTKVQVEQGGRDKVSLVRGYVVFKTDNEYRNTIFRL